MHVSRFLKALTVASMLSGILATPSFAGEPTAPPPPPSEAGQATPPPIDPLTSVDRPPTTNRPRPPAPPPPLPQETGTTQSSGLQNIIAVALNDPNLSTFANAVSQSIVFDTINGGGPFTVFAPSNEAFAQLPAGTLDNLTNPANRLRLDGLLRQHILPARVTSAEIIGTSLNPVTLRGSTLSIRGQDGMKVNDANVTQRDIPASNGIIHVIDKVLMPPMAPADSIRPNPPRR